MEGRGEGGKASVGVDVGGRMNARQLNPAEADQAVCYG